MGKAKRRKTIIAALVLPALILVALVVFWMFTTITVSFQEGNKILENPRQGFYVQIDSGEHSRIERIRQDGIRLILLAYNLNGYQSVPLDEEKLLELDTALSAAAEHNVHVIFRAAYGFQEGRDTVEPMEMSQLLEHIRQIAPLLNRHADRLLCVQAGMLGPWGEWHSSHFLKGSKTKQTGIRNRVAAAWLDELEPSIPLQLRRPLFIRQAVETGMPLERFGLHNDALLGSDTDMGTYRDESPRETELQWIERSLSRGRNGGEMPAVSDFTAADNAVREFRMLSLTYLNSRYNTAVLDSWDQQSYQGENALAYISRHLGSRLYLSEVRMPRRIMKYTRSSLTLTLRNMGFAPPQPGLLCYLAVRQNGTTVYHPLGDVVNYTENGRVTLTLGPDELPRPDPKAGFELGIRLGYGHPEASGDAYALSNDEGTITQDNILYFSAYVPDLTGWKRVRTDSY